MTAQAVVITEGYSSVDYPVKKIKWAWTSDSVTGAIVDSTTTGEVNKTTEKYTGQAFALITDPGNSPTDNYDVTILDDDGYDVLAGAGADRDTSNNEYVLASSLRAMVSTQLRLNVANCGTSKTGVVILYIAS